MFYTLVFGVSSVVMIFGLCDFRFSFSKYLVADSDVIDIGSHMLSFTFAVLFLEIINGFREQYGSCSASRLINPDIVVLGKSIARGLPIGLVIISEKALNPNKKLPFWGGTFSASPIQMTYMFDTLEKLSILDYQDIQKNLLGLIERLSNCSQEFGLQITTGCNFARIKRGSSSSARAFVAQDQAFERFRETMQKNAIYIARNGLVFPSIFDINKELPDNQEP